MGWYAVAYAGVFPSKSLAELVQSLKTKSKGGLVAWSLCRDLSGIVRGVLEFKHGFPVTIIFEEVELIACSPCTEERAMLSAASHSMDVERNLSYVDRNYIEAITKYDSYYSELEQGIYGLREEMKFIEGPIVHIVGSPRIYITTSACMSGPDSIPVKVRLCYENNCLAINECAANFTYPYSSSIEFLSNWAVATYARAEAIGKTLPRDAIKVDIRGIKKYVELQLYLTDAEGPTERNYHIIKGRWLIGKSDKPVYREGMQIKDLDDAWSNWLDMPQAFIPWNTYLPCAEGEEMKVIVAEGPENSGLVIANFDITRVPFEEFNKAVTGAEIGTTLMMKLAGATPAPWSFQFDVRLTAAGLDRTVSIKDGPYMRTTKWF